ncbi:hypothetical protein JOB18_013860 [Solea senegalensis]|uniref:Uncharacterized protein n=1 Tax=Solea senegalensis TaxID=28829 RepID=A0AAV6QHK4_SOLSE|nr:hypothetical protein JOB18_013860 [Solea senegalensis]
MSERRREADRWQRIRPPRCSSLKEQLARAGDAERQGHSDLDARAGNTGAHFISSAPAPRKIQEMGGGENMGHMTEPAGHREKTLRENLDVDPLFIRFLRTFKEVLKFVLFSYTVLFGALLLARWTTYFMVGK